MKKSNLAKTDSPLSLRQAKLIFDSLLDGILIINFEGDILFANHSSTRLFNKSIEQLIMQNFGFPVNPNEIQEIQLIQGKELITVQMLSTIIRWKRHDAYLVSLRDVSEIKKLEQEIFSAYRDLKISDSKLRELNADLEYKVEERTNELLALYEKSKFLLDSMPQKVWTADTSGNVDYFNQTWYSYVGASKSFNPDDWVLYVHPEDVEKTRRLWKNAVKTGTFFQSEHRIKDVNGNYRWHLSRALPQKDKKDNVLMWVGTSTDIHEKKLIEERKDHFISIASHELKTPLTSLKAFIQLAEATLNGNTTKVDALKLNSYIQKVSSSANKLHDLVTDLLDASKIQSGKMVLSFKEVDISKLIKDTVSNAQSMFSTYRIQLQNVEEAGIIVADRNRLEQVLVNLISNAVKYSPNADKMIITVKDKEKSVQVSVKDFGIGIPGDQVPYLFNRFFRVEKVSARFQGIGLGLYISSEIIRGHGGRMWVKSKVNSGSTFYFEIPKQQENTDIV